MDFQHTLRNTVGLPRSHIGQNSFIISELNIHLKYQKNKMVSVSSHFWYIIMKSRQLLESSVHV